MIIGYDFWADGVFVGENPDAVLITDNDGVAFDNCNVFGGADTFALKGGTFDELYVANTDDVQIGDMQNIEKQSWSADTVLLAAFQNNLIGGTIGIDGKDIVGIQVKRRKKGDELWQLLGVMDYSSDIDLYVVNDKYIENEETYEYCVAPVAIDGTVGTNGLPKETYISYDYAHMFDNTDAYDLIYNVKIDSISKNIGANTIDTLGSQYPYVIYGQTDYCQGRIECLLVSAESAIGNINIRSEKILRNRILQFLSNKQYKILKNNDGLYMLINIIGSPTLTPVEGVDGVYTVSFEFVQVGDANNLDELALKAFEFNYKTHTTTLDTQGNERTVIESHTKNIG